MEKMYIKGPLGGVPKWNSLSAPSSDKMLATTFVLCYTMYKISMYKYFLIFKV